MEVGSLYIRSVPGEPGSSDLPVNASLWFPRLAVSARRHHEGVRAAAWRVAYRLGSSTSRLRRYGPCMATDHWPWDALIPVGTALGGYLVKAVQDGLTRRHEDRRRFSSDMAKHSALYLDHVIEWRLVIEEVMRLMDQRDLVSKEIDQALEQTPDAPTRPKWVEEDKRINAAYDACVKRSREHEMQCRESLSNGIHKGGQARTDPVSERHGRTFTATPRGRRPRRQPGER